MTDRLPTYEEFQAEVRRLRAERWAAIVAAEPPGRPPGRRPRDPEQERLLLRADRRRLERRRRETPEIAPPPADPDRRGDRD